MSVSPRRESHELDRVLKLSLEAVLAHRRRGSSVLTIVGAPPLNNDAVSRARGPCRWRERDFGESEGGSL